MKKGMSKKLKQNQQLRNDPHCPHCHHPQCEMCTHIPSFRGFILYVKGYWLMEIPEKSLLKGILCCNCQRAAYEVQWFAGSIIIEHSPGKYYGTTKITGKLRKKMKPVSARRTAQRSAGEHPGVRRLLKRLKLSIFVGRRIAGV